MAGGRVTTGFIKPCFGPFGWSRDEPSAAVMKRRDVLRRLSTLSIVTLRRSTQSPHHWLGDQLGQRLPVNTVTLVASDLLSLSKDIHIYIYILPDLMSPFSTKALFHREHIISSAACSNFPSSPNSVLRNLRQTPTRFQVFLQVGSFGRTQTPPFQTQTPPERCVRGMDRSCAAFLVFVQQHAAGQT